MTYTKRSVYFGCIAAIAIFALLAACGGQVVDRGREVIANQPAEQPAEQSVEQSIEDNVNSETEVVDLVTEDSEGFRTFMIVPGESKASYIVQEEFFAGALSKLGIEAGKAEIVGSTDQVEGQLQLGPGLDEPLGKNHFTVNVNTFATDQERRDKWITENGPSFNRFPTAEFVATKLEGTPATYTDGEEVTFIMHGELTIREVVQEVTFEVMAALDGKTISGIATTSSKLTDWGIDPPNFANTLTVADEFKIQVVFIAREL
ncbi:MAG: YceI family protein [Chloroflexota bacterium]